MALLKKIFLISIYTNVLIALAAAAQCALTYLLLGQQTNYYIVGIEGGATLLLYNFSLWWSKPQRPEESKFARTQWVFRNEWVMWFNNVLALLVLVYAVFHVHLLALSFLGVIGVLSLLYGFPLWDYEGRRVGLRQIPGAKVFYISLIWVCSSVILPFVELYAGGVLPVVPVFATLCLLKFIFLVVCTLPFDIRDRRQDALYHLKTIPVLIGEGRARKICYALLALHTFIIFLAPYTISLKLGLLLTNLVIYILFRQFIFRRGGDYHRVYLLDACLVIQYLMVLLFSLVN